MLPFVRKDATMVHYSVIIPQRDCGDALREQVPRLRGQLDKLALPYEILCVDDGSTPATIELIAELARAEPALRLLRLDLPSGTSTALSAGITAAQGDVVIAIEPGDRYTVEQIPHLVAKLSRLDLVVGRLQLGGWRKLRHRVARIPRWALLGIDVRHPDCLFWAARREAIEGIHLARGMRRYLPWLVARRGFRVGDIYVSAKGKSIRLDDPPANPLDLLMAWWTCRRWRNDTAHEIRPAHSIQALRTAARQERI
jgi:glycosyltransferase involved in cell wall biosynthesis